MKRLASGAGLPPAAPADTDPLGYTAAAMRRTAILLTMLFAMFWQSVALARIGSPVNPLADLAHAALHWQGAAHHHGDDGSYQLGDCSESVQHVVTDHAGASLALESSPSHDFSCVGSATPASLDSMSVPDPTLDGLLRPPRPTA